MNAVSPSGNPAKKRAALPGCVMWIFRLVRMFWVTELALLIVVVFGMRAGWSEPRQWSDGFFLAAVAQVVVAAAAIQTTMGETLEASFVRYVDHGSIPETRYQLFMESLRKRKFAVTVIAGALLTTLIAGIVLLV